MRSIRNRLEADAEFRAFHEGRKVPLPRFYREAYRRRLGRYSELVREALISPILEPPRATEHAPSPAAAGPRLPDLS